MAFTETISDFLDTNDFAIAATYNGSTTVNGIFDAAYLDVNGIGGTNPTFLCATASVAADPTGKTLVVSSVNYIIRGFEPQDNGATVLLQLEKQ